LGKSPFVKVFEIVVKNLMQMAQNHLTFSLFFMGFLALNYLVFSYGGYWFFYQYLGPRIPHRLIQEKMPSKEQIKKEKYQSLSTQIIYFILGNGLYWLYEHNNTKIYSSWDKYGLLYFLISFLIIHQLHDAYFYWTHRLMHEWKPIRRFHLHHHETSVPTPFAALSFHPVEATIHALFWFFIAILIPLPVHWFFIFYSFMFYINMWGHTNYEFWHKDLLTHPILKFLNTPTHHNLHHLYHRFNYGIYYNFWDKICRTNHPLYETHYRTLKARTEHFKKSKILKWMKL